MRSISKSRPPMVNIISFIHLVPYCSLFKSYCMKASLHEVEMASPHLSNKSHVAFPNLSLEHLQGKPEQLSLSTHPQSCKIPHLLNAYGNHSRNQTPASNKTHLSPSEKSLIEYHHKQIFKILSKKCEPSEICSQASQLSRSRSMEAAFMKSRAAKIFSSKESRLDSKHANSLSKNAFSHPLKMTSL